MKTFTLKSTKNKKKLKFLIPNNRTVFVGQTDFITDIIKINKYIINKHLKLNISVSKTGYNCILYTYKLIND